MDSGTGASCIYPLLGCAEHKNWKFLATDIYEPSIKCAKENIARNKLADRIIVQQTTQEHVVPLDYLQAKDTTTVFHFLMCNPPFYSSKKDFHQSRQEKAQDPFMVCTGADHEMITPGGELDFVTRMFQESLIVKHRVHWFSCLLGKKADLKEIQSRLEKEEAVSQIRTYATLDSGRTRRWIIAWSFSDFNKGPVHT